MLSVVERVLARAEGVAELAEVDELRHLRFADDELRAVLDGLVLVGKPPRQRVARVVGPLDDLEQLALDEVHDAHRVCTLLAIGRSRQLSASFSRPPVFRRYRDELYRPRVPLEPAGDGLESGVDEISRRPVHASLVRRSRPRPAAGPAPAPAAGPGRSAGARGVGLLQLLDQRLRLLHVEHRQRRAAVRARRAPGRGRSARRSSSSSPSARSAAAPAICSAVSGRMKSFSRRKSKKVVSRPWSFGTAQVLEPRRALHVLREPQPRLAARALREVGVRERRRAASARR